MEHWSARGVIGGSLIGCGVVTSSIALVHTSGQLYLARFLLGAAEAGYFPGVVVYLTHWFIRDDRAKAGSNFMAAIPAVVCDRIAAGRMDPRASLAWHRRLALGVCSRRIAGRAAGCASPFLHHRLAAPGPLAWRWPEAMDRTERLRGRETSGRHRPAPGSSCDPAPWSCFVPSPFWPLHGLHLWLLVSDHAEALVRTLGRARGPARRLALCRGVRGHARRTAGTPTEPASGTGTPPLPCSSPPRPCSV